MKLVIVIPDKDRRDIYWTNGKRVANLIGEYKVLAVLPEGHGDLISREALKEDIVKLCRQINASNGITVPTLAFTRVIDNAPTVDIKDIYQEGYYDGHLEGYTKAINEGGAK